MEKFQTYTKVERLGQQILMYLSPKFKNHSRMIDILLLFKICFPPYLFIYLLIYIRIYIGVLIYNVVLVSGVQQQSESVIHIHISTLF